MSSEYSYLQLKHIETLCFELASALYNAPGYRMPDLQYINKHIMESALEAPKLPYYPTIFDKAATLGYQIIQGHPLKDGNKRIGIVATLVFLMINGYTLNVSRGHLSKTALDVAIHKIDKPRFTKWIRKNTRPVPKKKQGKRQTFIESIIGIFTRK